MIVLAHGAVGPLDELILVVPAIAVLVLAVGALRRRNAQHLAARPADPGPAEDAPAQPPA